VPYAGGCQFTRSGPIGGRSTCVTSAVSLRVPWRFVECLDPICTFRRSWKTRPRGARLDHGECHYFRVDGAFTLRPDGAFRSGDLRGTPAVIISERLAKDVFGTTDVIVERSHSLAFGGSGHGVHDRRCRR